MATYNFPTTLGAGVKFTSSDILKFATQSANTLVFSVETTGIKVTSGVSWMVLTGFTNLAAIATANWQFDDGSKVIIGDGSVGTVADASNNTLVGSAVDDYLDGLAGDDTLNGGYGDDILKGGLGIDTATYAGIDSGVSVNLGNTDKQDTFGAGQDTLSAIENLIGSSYNDTLTGTSTANRLDGGLGIDTLTGGDGNDTYIVTAGDVVTEASTTDAGAADTVYANVDYTLAANVENLFLTGSAVNGVGNIGQNTITGTAGANILNGAGGADTLKGGAGNDIYIFNDGDTIIEASGAGTDIVHAKVTTTLAANVENLRLMGNLAINGTGNTLDNIIYASAGANTLDGAAGTDTVSYQFGASAGVTVSLAVAAAQTTLGSGADTLSNFENLTGSNYNDTLTGDANSNVITGGLGNDSLNGGGGVDTLVGGLGNDKYTVNTTTDTITELANQGDDKVTANLNGTAYTLSSANVEDLTLGGAGGGFATDGTGNALNNDLVGNTGDNNLYGLSGNDTLDGKGGTDNLEGGLGNDTYYLNDADTVTENTSEGTDLVISSLANYTLLAEVENLTLTGASAINGTGNDLPNILTGNGAANTLNGGLGADRMIGGNGNDTYVVNIAGDVIVEAATTKVLGEVVGTDTVESSINYVLGNNLENLTLLAGSATGASGNSLNNVIKGNDAANSINGYGNITTGPDAGVDTLTGNDGADVFVFSATTHTGKTAATADIITDFTTGTDKINLTTIYGGLATYIAGAAFSGADEVRLDAAGVLYGDVNGDKVADFAIALTGTSDTPVAGDFIF